MQFNHKFTKNEGILLVNALLLTIIIVIIFIAFIGINEYTSFYEGILTILLISIYSPLGLVLFGVMGVYVYVVFDLIIRIHKNEKTRKNNEIKKYNKVERSIIVFEIINLIVLVGGYCYIFFIAQPQHDRDVQNRRNESIANTRYETNSELVKFKCEILPKNDPAENLAEAVRLSEVGEINAAIQQLKWAVEKFEFQRDYLQQMKTPNDQWKSVINNTFTFSSDNIDMVDKFKYDIKELEINKYNLSKEQQQSYIFGLAAPGFEMQSFRENVISLFAKVRCN